MESDTFFWCECFGFPLCQNNAFYSVDADCVGILEDNIDWKLNRQWLDLLSKSGTPLFVSIQPKKLNAVMKNDLRKAFHINSVQQKNAEPIDWQYNNAPQEWIINGKKTAYDFVMDSYPDLLPNRIQKY